MDLVARLLPYCFSFNTLFTAYLWLLGRLIIFLLCQSILDLFMISTTCTKLKGFMLLSLYTWNYHLPNQIDSGAEVSNWHSWDTFQIKDSVCLLYEIGLCLEPLVLSNIFLLNVVFAFATNLFVRKLNLYGIYFFFWLCFNFEKVLEFY